MMFTCVPAACTDPGHDHRVGARPRGRAAQSVTAARESASRKLVRKKKASALHIDLHCHYLNPEVHAKVVDLNPAQHEPAARFANALTREVNVKQIRDRGPKLSSIEVRLKDMDRMGIDMQAVSPAPNQCCYWPDPDFGAAWLAWASRRIASGCCGGTSEKSATTAIVAGTPHVPPVATPYFCEAQ